MAGYVEAAEAYFRSPVERLSLDRTGGPLPRGWMRWRCCWPGTPRPRPAAPGSPTRRSPRACREHPDVFTGLGSVNPHKGEAAVAEVANIAALGLRGVKFHPSLQAFAPDDPLVLAGVRRLRAAWPACPVPHRDQRDRGAPARRPGHPARLRPPDQARRRSCRPSRADRGGRPFRLALAHGTGRYGAAQDQRLHRHLRLVTAPDPGRADQRTARPAVRPVRLGQRLPVPRPGALPRPNSPAWASPDEVADQVLRGNAARILGLA